MCVSCVYKTYLAQTGPADRHRCITQPFFFTLYTHILSLDGNTPLEIQITSLFSSCSHGFPASQLLLTEELVGIFLSFCPGDGALSLGSHEAKLKGENRLRKSFI